MRITSNVAKARDSAQRYAHRRRSREVVRQRYERGGAVCEGCGLPSSVVDVAHLFSRAGHIINDQLASDPLLCLALCCTRTPERAGIGCHELIDRNIDTDLRDRLRWEAIDRYTSMHRLPRFNRNGCDPLGAGRALEQMLSVDPQATP